MSENRTDFVGDFSEGLLVNLNVAEENFISVDATLEFTSTELNVQIFTNGLVGLELARIVLLVVLASGIIALLRIDENVSTS